MSNRIFRDPKLEAEFQRNGYVKMPLLNRETITRMNEIIDLVIPDDTLKATAPFYVSMFEQDTQIKLQLNRLITDYVAPHFENILHNHRYVAGNVFFKLSGAGDIDVHDHADCTEESKYTSLTVWMPLQDTNEENGTLQLVPKSHKLFPFISHWNEPYYFINFIEQLRDYHIPMNSPAGEAVVFCDKTIHYSDINRTSKTRRALQLKFLPAEAPYLFYHLDKENMDKGFEVYECKSDFYINNPCSLSFFAERPKGLRYLHNVPYQNRFISEDEFVAARNDGESRRRKFYGQALVE